MLRLNLDYTSFEIAGVIQSPLQGEVVKDRICSVGISEMGALVAQLGELLLRQSLVRRVDVSGVAPGVFPPVPEPQEGVHAGAHADHAERHGVAPDVPGALGRETGS